MFGKLYIIATPIGNLEDITFRALNIMKQVDVIFCEDTRQTKRLLDRYEIKTRVDSYREQVHSRKLVKIVDLLRNGQEIGLVSDAGTPGVSDPGSILVRDLLVSLPEIEIIPIPGPSAVTTAISAAGLPAGGFTFLGFPPHRKGRAAFFKKALEYSHPVVLYESPHRIESALISLIELAPDRHLCLFRELTKLYESTYRGTAKEVKDKLAKNSSRGEFVLVIEGK